MERDSELIEGIAYYLVIFTLPHELNDLISTTRCSTLPVSFRGYETVTFRKEKVSGKDKWLYSFRDRTKTAQEERNWLRRAKKNNSYSLAALWEKQDSFGTVVLKCDLDLPAETAYKAYSNRCEIEIVMRYYKSACEFDKTHIQDNYSVIGSEFCDFFSTLLTFRPIRRFDQAKLLKERTYK